jgi:hypothetical protein
MGEQRTDRNGKSKLPTVDDILRGSSHALTVFKPGAADKLAIYLKRGKPYLKCFATDKEGAANPEEIIRQLYIKMLTRIYLYCVATGVYWLTYAQDS